MPCKWFRKNLLPARCLCFCLRFAVAIAMAKTNFNQGSSFLFKQLTISPHPSWSVLPRSRVRSSIRASRSLALSLPGGGREACVIRTSFIPCRNVSYRVLSYEYQVTFSVVMRVNAPIALNAPGRYFLRKRAKPGVNAPCQNNM